MRGEPAAFGAFYRRHEDQVLSFFFARTGDAALASARRFRPRKKRAAWLFGIARDKLAKSRRPGRVEDGARRRLGMAPLVLTDDAIKRIAELDHIARACVDELPGDQHDAVMARISDQLDYPDIAKDLRCSEALVRNRVSRARDAQDTLEGEVSRIPELEAELVASAERLQRPRGLLGPATRTALAAAAVAVVAVLAVAWESDVERPAAAPDNKVVVTDVDDGIRWRLDGRVLTAQLLPSAPDRTVGMVNGARIRATCGTNVASPRETTLTRLWPAGQTSLSYRFPRDASSWCRLADPTGRSVALVTFPGTPGARELMYETAARELITDTALNWARVFASSTEPPIDYMDPTAVDQLKCRRHVELAPDRDGLVPIPNCTRPTPAYRLSFRDATIHGIAIKGDQAAVRFSNGETIQLQRQPNDDWLIAKIAGDAGRGIFNLRLG